MLRWLRVQTVEEGDTEFWRSLGC